MDWVGYTDFWRILFSKSTKSFPTIRCWIDLGMHRMIPPSWRWNFWSNGGALRKKTKQTWRNNHSMLGWFPDIFVLEIFSLKRVEVGTSWPTHQNAAEILVCIGCMKDQENAPGMTWLTDTGCFKRKFRILSNVTRKTSRVKLTKIQKDLEGNLFWKVYIKGIRNAKNLKRICFLNMGSFKGPPMVLIFQNQLVSQKVILYNYLTGYMRFSPKYQDANKACSWKLGVQLIKKYDLFNRARGCWLCFFGENPENHVDPNFNDGTWRQKGCRQTASIPEFFNGFEVFSNKNQEIFSLNSQWWVDLFTCLPRNERNIHLSFQMLISSSEVDRLDSKNAMASHGVESTFSVPRNRFHTTKEKQNRDFVAFFAYLLTYLFFVLLRLNLFPMSWAGSPRPRDILFLAKMGSLHQV